MSMRKFWSKMTKIDKDIENVEMEFEPVHLSPVSLEGRSHFDATCIVANLSLQAGCDNPKAVLEFAKSNWPGIKWEGIAPGEYLSLSTRGGKISCRYRQNWFELPTKEWAQQLIAQNIYKDYDVWTFALLRQDAEEVIGLLGNPAEYGEVYGQISNVFGMSRGRRNRYMEIFRSRYYELMDDRIMARTDKLNELVEILEFSTKCSIQYTQAAAKRWRRKELAAWIRFFSIEAGMEQDDQTYITFNYKEVVEYMAKEEVVAIYDRKLLEGVIQEDLSCVYKRHIRKYAEMLAGKEAGPLLTTSSLRLLRESKATKCFKLHAGRVQDRHAANNLAELAAITVKAGKLPSQLPDINLQMIEGCGGASISACRWFFRVCGKFNEWTVLDRAVKCLRSSKTLESYGFDFEDSKLVEAETMMLQLTYSVILNRDFAEISASINLHESDYVTNEREWLRRGCDKKVTTIKRIAEVVDGVYKMRILDDGDPRILYAGALTNCCQHPQGVGSTCAWHAATEKDGAIIAIFKDEKMVAQSWIWTTGVSLMFDNVETLSCEAYGDVIYNMYMEAASRFYSAGYREVMVGIGYNDLPQLLKLADADEYPAAPRGCYTDTKSGVKIFPKERI